jgi:hypothetical protein
VARGTCTAVAMGLLLGVAAPTVSAAAPADWSVRLGSGVSVATGDFGLDWGTGAPVAVALEASPAPAVGSPGPTGARVYVCPMSHRGAGLVISNSP